MDSKVVNKTIREIVRPALKAEGFTKYTARTFWRHHDDRIDVVNLQSFNAYNADVLGVTTYSYSVNLGCYMLYIPELLSIKEKEGLLLPQEYQCHFRGRLHRSFKQPENNREDIWFIDENGKYLEAAATDVESALQSFGRGWFDKFQSKLEVLRILSEEDEEMGILWGFGKNPSPIRAYLTGYVALNLKKHEIAKDRLQYAVDSGCFESLFKSVDTAIERGL